MIHLMFMLIAGWSSVCHEWETLEGWGSKQGLRNQKNCSKIVKFVANL